MYRLILYRIAYQSLDSISYVELKQNWESWQHNWVYKVGMINWKFPLLGQLWSLTFILSRAMDWMN